MRLRIWLLAILASGSILIKLRVIWILMVVGVVWSPIPLLAQATPRPTGAQPIRLTKPRIGPLPEAQWTDVHRKLVAKYSRDGRVGNDIRTLMNVPGILESVAPFFHYISNDSSLSPRHRELLILRTAWLCGSEYLWASHAALAKTLGMTVDEIRRIAQGPDARGWGAFEITILRFADELYRNASVSDATWKAVTARYDMNNTMDAAYTVADLMMLSLMYNSMGVQTDAWLTERLPADIPYRLMVPEPEEPLKIGRAQLPDGGGPGALYALLKQGAAPRALNTLHLRQNPTLPPRVRELLILRTAWNSRSEYEWAQHMGSFGGGRKLGLDPARIAAGPDAGGWDPLEALLLRAVDELFRDSIISDRTWNTLAARYDTIALMELLLAVTSYRMVAMPLNTFGVQVNPGEERFPTRTSSR